jgi:hypothetical protein
MKEKMRKFSKAGMPFFMIYTSDVLEQRSSKSNHTFYDLTEHTIEDPRRIVY